MHLIDTLEAKHATLCWCIARRAGSGNDVNALHTRTDAKIPRGTKLNVHPVVAASFLRHYWGKKKSDWSPLQMSNDAIAHPKRPTRFLSIAGSFFHSFFLRPRSQVRTVDHVVSVTSQLNTGSFKEETARGCRQRRVSTPVGTSRRKINGGQKLNGRDLLQVEEG